MSCIYRAINAIKARNLLHLLPDKCKKFLAFIKLIVFLAFFCIYNFLHFSHFSNYPKFCNNYCDFFLVFIHFLHFSILAKSIYRTCLITAQDSRLRQGNLNMGIITWVHIHIHRLLNLLHFNNKTNISTSLQHVSLKRI